MKKQIAVVVLTCGFVALAQQPPKTSNSNTAAESITKTTDNTIITSMPSEGVQKIIQSMGFECTRNKDENGKDETYFTFRAEGYKVAVFITDSTFIELYNAFTDAALTPTVVNEWNQGHRFSRAYIDKDGNATIEDDLILTGGVTRENIENFVATFRDTVGMWARFVLDHKPKDAKP